MSISSNIIATAPVLQGSKTIQILKAQRNNQPIEWLTLPSNVLMEIHAPFSNIDGLWFMIYSSIMIRNAVI